MVLLCKEQVYYYFDSILMLPPQKEYMEMAIREAQKALTEGEGMAFGSVVILNGEVIGIGHNTVNSDHDATAHAEVNAIRAACKNLQTSNLSGATLYSTCEPCPMCFTACWWANIKQLIYGAHLHDATNVSREIELSSEYLNEKGGSIIEIIPGFMREECLTLYSVV